MSEEKKNEIAVADEPMANKPAVFEHGAIIKGRLVVVSGSGKSSLILQAMDDVAGLWIRSETKDDKFPNSLVAIYDDEKQGPVIGFYKDDKANLAMTCAIGMGADGHPQIQVPNGRGGFGFIGLSELLDKVKSDWR